MNFLTASVQIVVDDSKLDAQLAKVKQKILKSTSVIEKSYRKQDKAIEVVNKSLTATVRFTKEVFGQTIRVEKVLGRWSTMAWNFYRKMVRNHEIFSKILITAGNIALTLGKGTVWSVRAVGKALKDLIWPMKKIRAASEEINKGFRVWSISDILLHPIEAVKDLKENLDETKGAIDMVNDSLDEQTYKIPFLLNYIKKQNVLLSERIKLQKELEIRMSPPDAMGRTFTGQTMQMVLFGVPGMFTAIYDAAKWAFEGILNITTSVFQKIFDTSIWFKTGVIAAFVGIYYKITQAAMDAEDALSFDELGVTRTALKRFKDVLTSVLATLGKPFLSGIQAVSNAVADWLEKSTPKITAWAEKFAEKLEWLRNAFIDWVVFLSTDFKGGVFVALQVVAELFKGLGDVLILTMEYVGRVAAKTLMDTFIFGIESWLPKATRVADKKLKSFGKWLLKVTKPSTKRITRFTGIPLGETEYQRMPVKPRVQTE